MLTPDKTASLLNGIIDAHPDKKFIFTVSPIRHLGDGAHANTVSKASLHIALEQVLGTYP
ncbi:MAG TPA: GSCFA domain protein, partial [Rikenellaceae bacterium]|nr:GSCFA domain protein [Rikenellaceae bacterium]